MSVRRRKALTSRALRKRADLIPSGGEARFIKVHSAGEYLNGENLKRSVASGPRSAVRIGAHEGLAHAWCATRHRLQAA